MVSGSACTELPIGGYSLEEGMASFRFGKFRYVNAAAVQAGAARALFTIIGSQLYRRRPVRCQG
jgi:hypothetical protein